MEYITSAVCTKTITHMRRPEFRLVLGRVVTNVDMLVWNFCEWVRKEWEDLMQVKYWMYKNWDISWPSQLAWFLQWPKGHSTKWGVFSLVQKVCEGGIPRMQWEVCHAVPKSTGQKLQWSYCRDHWQYDEEPYWEGQVLYCTILYCSVMLSKYTYIGTWSLFYMYCNVMYVL